MSDKILIYEYPIDNDIPAYLGKKINSFKNGKYSDALLTFITDIKVNDAYSRDYHDRCLNISNLDGIYDAYKGNDPKIKKVVDNILKEYSHKSCDPVKFNYSVYPVKNMQIFDTYKYDIRQFESFFDINLAKIGLADCNMSKYVLEGLLLPEFNFITSYRNQRGRSCNIGGPVISNKNFKIPSLNKDILLDIFKKVKDVMKTRIEGGNNDELKKVYSQMENTINHNNITKMPKIIYIHKYSIGSSYMKCCLFGDIHASLQSLLRSLIRLVVMGLIDSNFKLVKDFHIFFLGDLIDRNIYGIETIFTILNLFLLNPDNVHIIRGNHEEMSLNYRFCFSNEFVKLVEDGKNELELYAEYVKVFSYFPTAILLKDSKNEYIQLCHGGFYRNSNFIKNITNNDTFIMVDNEKHKLDISWADFKCGNLTEDELTYAKKNNMYGNETKSRGPIYRFNETIEYQKDTNIKFIVRGHQDLVDNTKVILQNAEQCKVPNKVYNDMIPMEYVDTIKEVTLDRKDYSFKVDIPDVHSIDMFVSKYKFPPMITLTTGTTSRFVDCDGFAIMEINTSSTSSSKVANGGAINIVGFNGNAGTDYKHAYEVYKKVYNKIKKLKR